jgi:multisubunit Na+/H+ antiporter MnhB subunit
LGAVVLLHLMPYQYLLMVALLPDATLNLFWCGTLWAVWQAMKKENWPGWILAGLLFGGALLSKYHAVLLPVCLFFYMVMSPDNRHWLRKIKPYAALGIGVIMFLPNIMWNARHEWISYRFQLAHGGGGHFEVANIFEVFGAQLGVWSPIIGGLFVISIIDLLRRKPLRDMDRYLIWTSMPVFVFFYSIGMLGKILPHWPAVGWWTGSLAVVVVILRKISQKDKIEIRWKRWSVAAGLVGFIMTAVLVTGLFIPIVAPIYNYARTMSQHLHQKFPTITPLEPYRPKFDISNELYGWDEIGKRVEDIRAQMPQSHKTFIFGHRPFTSSQVAVQLEPETAVTTLHRKLNQYRLWFNAPAHKGWDALFIDDDRYFKGPQRYRHLFNSVDPVPEIITVYRRGYLAREARVYKYFGFKGKYE